MQPQPCINPALTQPFYLLQIVSLIICQTKGTISTSFETDVKPVLLNIFLTFFRLKTIGRSQNQRDVQKTARGSYLYKVLKNPVNSDISRIIHLDKFLVFRTTLSQIGQITSSMEKQELKTIERYTFGIQIKGPPFDPRRPTLLLLTVVFLRVLRF